MLNSLVTGDDLTRDSACACVFLCDEIVDDDIMG